MTGDIPRLGIDQVVHREISVQEAATAGLYHGALRNDEDYQKALIELEQKIKVGWARRLMAKLLGTSMEPTVLEALGLAEIALPKGVPDYLVAYSVHHEWLLHEIAALKGFFDTKPTPNAVRLVLRERRNFHARHQFKGFTSIQPRGTSHPTYIPIWEQTR